MAAKSAASLPDLAVSIKGLVKRYAPSSDRKGAKEGKLALDHVDLAIPRGGIFGLLGPNGAGKSTLINILAQLVRKTEGEVRIWDIDLDRDPRHAAAAIGVVPQELNIDPFFTPRDLLDLQAGMYGVPKAERRTMQLLEALSLADKATAYARTLSGGMRRRLMVAKAMVHNPPVLVLDEPTAGVDVELRQQLWAYVRELHAQGVTILLTTHYLEEAEELCDQIAIINHGKVIACEPTAKLVKRLDTKEVLLTLGADLTTVPAALASFAPELKDPRHLKLHYRTTETKFGALLDAIRATGLEIADLSTVEADLEDIFLELTRRRPAA
ncbi:ABC-2 type transport system ATP-binding protein [Dongia mobilis]|uniref:ABC-2 type transport system ATP-binding protein n=1 Tax=Dongia mobilis TaxID=578943 RepID=A0A4V3DDX5_9PROT|nr:ABC transporter ATP-binding protein [Dongia mobilis]TDQ78775.1 ABC-2 type transport system ATP-binding protein [Dongia mobilis]